MFRKLYDLYNYLFRWINRLKVNPKLTIPTRGVQHLYLRGMNFSALVYSAATLRAAGNKSPSAFSIF